ncbi:MAG: hypothetical protein Q8930_09930 [Bacillota bacterium]|nr:hypothetical protein [Bacillota bacterium]
MNKTMNIARGGLLAALTVLLIYMTNIVPTSRLTLLTVASAVIPYSILTTGARNSFIVYGAASALSLLLVGFRSATVAYVIFFGLYGFVKYYVEAINKIPYEIVLKLVYFNVSLFAIYMLYSTLFTDSISDKLPIYLIIAGAQAVFFIYDYALTILISYIRKRFIKA